MDIGQKWKILLKIELKTWNRQFDKQFSSTWHALLFDIRNAVDYTNCVKYTIVVVVKWNKERKNSESWNCVIFTIAASAVLHMFSDWFCANIITFHSYHIVYLDLQLNMCTICCVFRCVDFMTISFDCFVAYSLFRYEFGRNYYCFVKVM